MTTLRISITKEVLQATKDCADGLVNFNCALSFAVREIWPEANTNYDYISPFDWRKDKQRIFHHQGDWIKAFDCATPAERARMQPFSFEIEVPDEVIGEINIEEIRRICEGSKTLEVV